MDLKHGLFLFSQEQSFDALLATGKPLRVKAGFDPTAPDLHLGHAVLLKKLREFQDAGHTVVMIIGNTTASIGDPTGRNQARPPLTDHQIQENSWSYMTQACKILDRSKTVIRKNSDWFDEMKMSDVIRLMSNFTLSEIETRDDFKERKAACTPVFMHELLYPMLQAYDSFREGVDIELGGNDQFYNLLLGQRYMHQRGVTPQLIGMVPLLVGTDGVKKMSKSVGNHIGLTEEPFEMFSKVMSISDTTMVEWRNTLFPNKESWHPVPMEAKKDLAWRIVFWLHDEEKANAAEQEWRKIFSQREKPTDIPVAHLTADPLRLDKILANIGLASSVSEAGRLIKSGAVDINGIRATSHNLSTPLADNSEIRVGRQWKKITLG